MADDNDDPRKADVLESCGRVMQHLEATFIRHRDLFLAVAHGRGTLTAADAEAIAETIERMRLEASDLLAILEGRFGEGETATPPRVM